jgi:hypothetical protein
MPTHRRTKSRSAANPVCRAVAVTAATVSVLPDSAAGTSSTGQTLDVLEIGEGDPIPAPVRLAAIQIGCEADFESLPALKFRRRQREAAYHCSSATSPVGKNHLTGIGRLVPEIRLSMLGGSIAYGAQFRLI